VSENKYCVTIAADAEPMPGTKRIERAGTRDPGMKTSLHRAMRSALAQTEPRMPAREGRSAGAWKTAGETISGLFSRAPAPYIRRAGATRLWR